MIVLHILLDLIFKNLLSYWKWYLTYLVEYDILDYILSNWFFMKVLNILSNIIFKNLISYWKWYAYLYLWWYAYLLVGYGIRNPYLSNQPNVITKMFISINIIP